MILNFFLNSLFTQIQIAAADQGVPVRQASGTATLVVTVTRDLYDPIFFPANYQARIDQNVPVGTSVMTVSASDADTAVRNFMEL